MMKEFEIVCPLNREPGIKEIEARAGGRNRKKYVYSSNVFLKNKIL